jgi:hypothetical protein
MIATGPSVSGISATGAGFLQRLHYPINNCNTFDFIATKKELDFA